ncbi:MAG: 2-oxoacid:acceptor oxidoreductase family protein [Archaeoglobi archaeon]|nr:2-oxoacid:acceptor oxidoreductase family protein [Candidatus Mnemosynella sp.]
MRDLIEIRIHSRGGQGGVTAAKLMGLSAFHEGKKSSAFPRYGAERRGAPVVAFVRIGEKSVGMYSEVKNPDVVVVLDPSVMESVNVLEGLKENGIVFVNTKDEEIARKLKGDSRRVFFCDITGISLSLNLTVSGAPILNTPVLGALAKAGLFSMDAVRKAIREMFPKDERNVEAAEMAYEMTREV